MPDLTATPHKTEHYSFSVAALHTVFTGKGSVNFVSCSNESGGTVYLMLVDIVNSAAISSGETEPSFAPIAIEDGGYYESDALKGFADGCSIAVSSTPNVYTASAGAVLGSVGVTR